MVESDEKQFPISGNVHRCLFSSQSRIYMYSLSIRKIITKRLAVREPLLKKCWNYIPRSSSISFSTVFKRRSFHWPMNTKRCFTPIFIWLRARAARRQSMLRITIPIPVIVSLRRFLQCDHWLLMPPPIIQYLPIVVLPAMIVPPARAEPPWSDVNVVCDLHFG